MGRSAKEKKNLLDRELNPLKILNPKP